MDRRQPRRHAGADRAARRRAWGRLGDRYGRKIMVERSLVSFIVLFAAMAYGDARLAGAGDSRSCRACSRATGRCLSRWRPNLRRAIGCRTRSGSCRRPSGIGPGVGPVIGGVLAGLMGFAQGVPDDVGDVPRRGSRSCISRPTIARRTPRQRRRPRRGRVTFRNVLAFQNFILMMVVIFGLQFVDRSFGPVLPLWVEQSGVAHATRRADVGRAVLDHGAHRRARSSLLRQAAEALRQPRGDRRRRRRSPRPASAAGSATRRATSG